MAAPVGYKSWAEIASLPTGEQASNIRQSYEALAKIADVERSTRILEMEQALYALADDKVRPFDRSRLQALLAMQPETAGTATATYPSLLDKMPGLTAMRHATTIQSIGHEFNPEDQKRLRVFFPRAFTSKAESRSSASLRPPPAPVAAAQPAKSKWAFWKKA